MNYHQGPRFMRGRGLGSIFSGLFRSLRPIAMKGFEAGKRLLNSDFAKTLGNEALNIGKEAIKTMAVDALEGKKTFKESADEQLLEAKSRIAKTLRGAGKRKRKSTPICSKKTLKKIKYSLLD